MYQPKLFAVCSILIAVPVVFAADGNELVGIGAVQKGTVGAGVAFPQDSTWALLNPASIVELDRRLDLSLEFLDIHRGIRPRGLPLIVNVSEVKMTDGSGVFIPSFGMIWPTDRGTFGFGVFGVQGNLADFRAPRTTLAIPDNGDRRSQLEIARIPLSYAYQFDNGWAIGGSLLGVFSRFRTDNLTLNLRPTEGDNDWDYGLGIGLQLGVYKKWDRIAIGAAWRSRQAMQQYDKYEDLIQWNLDLPQTIQAGVALRLTDKLHVLADYKWQEWSALKQQAETTIRGGLGWDDQHIYKLGLVYELNDRWTLRAGASHGKSPISDEFVFANATTPAFAEDHVAIGFSYQLTERSEFHFAWEHSFPEEREDNGRGDLFSILGQGTRASFQEDGVVVQYSFKF
jgi:long-chain fatty acid transport protein